MSEYLPSGPLFHDIASAHIGIIRAVFEAGTELSLGDSKSIGANRTTLDISNYQLRISNPTRRVLPADGPFELNRGLARFLWLASGNDRIVLQKSFASLIADFPSCRGDFGINT
jgi:hypothetical protein